MTDEQEHEAEEKETESTLAGNKSKVESEIYQDEETEMGVQELERPAVYMNVSLYNCNIRDAVIGSTNPVVSNLTSWIREKAQGREKDRGITGPGHPDQQSPPEWFYSMSNAAQVFALSVAVFSGNNLEYIVNTSDGLLEIVIGPRPKNEEDGNSIFGHGPTINELLVATQSKRFLVQANDAEVNTKSESICFISGEVSQFIFELAKNDPNFLKIKPKLIEWLTSVINTDSDSLFLMGSESPELTWSQAGIGIGSFIRNDFDTKMSRTIEKWAMSSNFRLRLMVGWIFLGIAADSTEDRFQSISQMLQKWIDSKNSHLRWTSVAALGKLCLLSSETSSQIMRFALDNIARAIVDNSIAIRRASQITLRVMYRYGHFQAISVLRSLASWLVPDDHIRNNSIAEAAIELLGENINLTSISKLHKPTIFSQTNGSIFDLPDFSASGIRETISVLLKQSFSHRRGSFVDYAINKLVQCLVQVDFESNTMNAQNARFVLQDLYDDSTTKKYVEHIFGLPAFSGLAFFNWNS